MSMRETRGLGVKNKIFNGIKNYGSLNLTKNNNNNDNIYKIYNIEIPLEKILGILKFEEINPLDINEYENNIINSHDEIQDNYMVFHSVEYNENLPIDKSDDITLLVYKEIISSSSNRKPADWSYLNQIHKIFKNIKGKIYFVHTNDNSSSYKNYLIFIPYETVSSGYSQSFKKLKKCFEDPREQYEISIKPKKKFNIINNPQLYSIFIRMLMCCDRVHDLKGRSTKTQKNVIMKQLKNLINILYEQAKQIKDYENDPFHKMIIDIYDLWDKGNVWSSVEDSMIILFLTNFSGNCYFDITNEIYKYTTNDIEIEFKNDKNDIFQNTNIKDVIDNAMGREKTTYKVFNNVIKPVIYPSTFIDGGTSLCSNHKPLVIKPAIPYEINFEGNWSIKRDFVVFDSSFVEEVKDNIIVNSKMVQDGSLNGRETDIYCLLNEKYTAKKVSKDESNLIKNQKQKQNENDFKVNVDWSNITPCISDNSYTIMNTAIKTTFSDYNNNVKFADSLWTKTLGDLGQILETISIDPTLANQTLTCHNDRCAAIIHICFQMVLNKGCTPAPSNEQPPNITSDVFLNSPSKKIYSKYQDSRFKIQAQNCIDNTNLLKMEKNFKRMRENSNNSTRKKARTGGSNTNVKHNKLDDLEIYEIYKNGLFSENVYESQNFNFKLTGKFLDTLEVMEQPLEERSLIHFMLRTDEKTFRKLYNKLTEEDQNEFKSFIIYNTTLMHEFCKKTGHNLEYPYVDECGVPLKKPEPLKTINLNELIGQINDYIMDITQEKEPRETQVPPQSNSRLLPPPPPNSRLLQQNHKFRTKPYALPKPLFDHPAAAAVAGQRRQNNKFRTKRRQNKKFRTQRRQKPLVRRINSRRRQPNYKFRTQRRQKPRKTQVRHKIKKQKTIN